MQQRPERRNFNTIVTSHRWGRRPFRTQPKFQSSKPLTAKQKIFRGPNLKKLRLRRQKQPLHVLNPRLPFNALSIRKPQAVSPTPQHHLSCCVHGCPIRNQGQVHINQQTMSLTFKARTLSSQIILGYRFHILCLLRQ